MPPAARDAAGQRDYGEEVLVWIEFLGRLKATGMPTREKLHYAALRSEGEHTAPERCALLEAHRDRVRANLAELQSCLLILDKKIDTYIDAEKRTHPHDYPSKP